jgi:redox-sensitive bicupin YhaK (pirin superfamily)
VLQIRAATTPDGGDFGWLKARHHFRVTSEGNPANSTLGSLLVWNDDEIAPGRGFDLHGHANMEIITRQTEGEPRWDARCFPKADRANQFVFLASGFSVDVDALRIRADARVLGATLLAGSELTYTIGNLRHAYLAPAQGIVTVNNQRLEVGDGIAASDETAVTIAAQTDAEIVLVVTN